MNKNRTGVLLLILAMAGFALASEEGAVVPFTEERWDLARARVVEHLDRQALAGTAFLKEAAFEDGVIEVDMATTEDTRSYPGVLFRIVAPGEYERFYIRPHRAPLYPDALQYVPSISGISAWQLYSGPGYTAGAPIPHDTWIPVRIEVKGTQARVFFGESNRPALEIPHLVRDPATGGIGLLGPPDGTAYFSNFRFRADDGLRFDPAPPPEDPPGAITDWELSQALPLPTIDPELHPSAQDLPDLVWTGGEFAVNGLVDISRFTGRTGREPDVVFARTRLTAEEERIFKLDLGYSDSVYVFLNGRLLFAGHSAYRQRDPSFVGIVGFWDTVFLPLKKGENELLLAVAESFGGWGFQARDGAAVLTGDGVERVWETERAFRIPETVVFDPSGETLYVSNYDGYNPSGGQGRQTVSRLTVDGAVEELDWATGLNNPTGLVIRDGKMFAVERGAVAVIDLATGEVVERYAIPAPAFPNDIAADEAGALYVSDSGAGVIHRLVDGEVTPWVSGADIDQPNGLHVQGSELFFGNNGDGRLKAANLTTGEVRTVARLAPGVIDGIESGPDGSLLVSLAEGKLYRVSPGGPPTRILDTTATGVYLANFAYHPGRRLLVAPTFVDGRVVAYRLE